MSQMITLLERLRTLRRRAVKETDARLNAQKQLSQRYERNIAALNSLSKGAAPGDGASALQMMNHSGYRRTLQRVIDWQKQEQALVELELRQLHDALLLDARREKSLDIVLETKRSEHHMEQERFESKATDAIAAQCWLRQKHLGR